MAILFDAPNVYLDGDYAGSVGIPERPRMAQISTTFIPDHDLHSSRSYIRGQILTFIFCEDGLVVISILPDTLYDTKRD